MAVQPQSKEPRVAPQRITRDDVVAAALGLTRTSGLASLTLRAVALQLGVQSPSLYHHIPGGLDELHSLVAESVVGLLEETHRREASPEMSPLERLERPLRDLGRLSEEYPGVLQYVLTTGRNRPRFLGGAQRTIEELLQSELGPVAPAAWLLVHTYVTGWVFAQRPNSSAAREHGFDKLSAVLAESEGMSEEKVLFEGLRAILAGLLVSVQEPNESEREAVTRTLQKFLQ